MVRYRSTCALPVVVSKASSPILWSIGRLKVIASASKEASKTASKPPRKQARKQGSKQAKKEASKQGRKQEKKQGSKEARKQGRARKQGGIWLFVAATLLKQFVLVHECAP